MGRTFWFSADTCCTVFLSARNTLANIVFYQVPHAFQQILSCEKTPCISDTIPAFEAMQFTWEELQKEMPHTADIIAKGLEKLAEYHGRVNDVLIYSLAIHMLFYSFWFFAHTFTVIHPAYKLQWFQKNSPGRVLEIKDLFINTVWELWIIDHWSTLTSFYSFRNTKIHQIFRHQHHRQPQIQETHW